MKYATYIPVYVGESFCQLRGRKMSTNERKKLTALGALTGLFDDFTDANNLTLSEIMHIIRTESDTSDDTQQNNDLLIELFRIIKGNTENHESLYELIEKICMAQIDSRKQTNPDITIEELKEITFSKGGYSMQLYRQAFDGNSSATELKLFYLLGAIGQLENDIFDIYDDFAGHTKTLATELPPAKTEAIYSGLHNEILKLTDLTDYSDKDKNAFKKVVNLIIARGYVALNQLKKLQTNPDKPLTLSQFSRKQLICDMEKPQNILKLMSFSTI